MWLTAEIHPTKNEPTNQPSHPSAGDLGIPVLMLNIFAYYTHKYLIRFGLSETHSFLSV